ncbi:hypothetical protein ON010_g17223 [Phytophthora cinnamomi]|nr:hypothetical protein ON010_g17223 [Phytophthora cinnamomi]
MGPSTSCITKRSSRVSRDRLAASVVAYLTASLAAAGAAEADAGVGLADWCATRATTFTPLPAVTRVLRKKPRAQRVPHEGHLRLLLEALPAHVARHVRPSLGRNFKFGGASSAISGDHGNREAMEEQDQGADCNANVRPSARAQAVPADQENMFEPELPVPGKGVIRNDRLLELMGVPTSEASSSAGCSAYSLDDEQTAPVAPLPIRSPYPHQQQHTCRPDCDCDQGVDKVEFFSDEEALEEKCDLRARLSNAYEAILDKESTEEGEDSSVPCGSGGPTDRTNAANQSGATTVVVVQCVARSSLYVLTCLVICALCRDRSPSREASHTLSRGTTTRKASLAECGMLRVPSKRRPVWGNPPLVEDRLHLLGLIYQYQQEERKRAEERQASSNVQPQLAPHSANAQRRRRYSVHERLYQLSKRNMAKDNNDHEHYSSSPASQRRRVRGVNVENIAHTVQRLHGLSKQYQQKQLLRSEERKQYFETLRPEACGEEEEESCAEEPPALRLLWRQGRQGGEMWLHG